MMSVHEAIRAAEAVLPGEAAAEGEDDARWQAIIAVADYIETDPEPVWRFAARWGSNEQEDVRMAVAACVLEHLLEHHFALIFPRVERLAREDARFAGTFRSCWRFGQAELEANRARWDRLRRNLG